MDAITLTGKSVTLDTTVEADRDAHIAIRSTDEVRAQWRGNDLEAEFQETLEGEGHQLTIRESAGTIIGLIQFYEELEPDFRHVSIDIYIAPKAHRNGYGSDAIATLVDYLIDELGHHRLTIDPAVDNAAAIACYTKVGFAPVGVMRQYERQADGTWRDGLLMELLANER